MKADWQNIIKRHSVFHVLNKKEIEHLIEVSDEQEYTKGDAIIREGEHGNSIFIIGSGAVEVVLPWRGEQTLHLATLSKGEFFGELALFEKPSRRSATVIAAEPCVLLEIAGADFLSVAQHNPDIVMGVIETVTSRLRDIGDQVIKVKLRDMDEKLDTLSTRIDAESRATSATLNATQTVFDQTSRRANEIIESAERSRSRLTTTASIIGTGITALVAVFGFIGYSQLQNVTSLTEKMEEKVDEIDGIATKIKQIKPSLDKDIADIREKVEQIDDIAPKVKRVSSELEFVDKQILRFYQTTVLRQFDDELTKDIDKATELYQTMLQLRNANITNEMFRIINARLLANALEEDDDYRADTGKIGDGIIEMLKTTDSDKTPRQELLTYFALLLSYIINGEQEQFEKTSKSFEESARLHQDLSIRYELPFDRLDYEELIGDLSVNHKDALRKSKQLAQIWRQIP